MKRVLFLILLLSLSLFGHRLYILADDDGRLLNIRAYYTKSSACKNCEVNIISNGDIIARGKLDADGRLTLPLKAKNIEIEVVASMGHKNIVSYESEEFTVSDSNKSQKAEQAAKENTIASTTNKHKRLAGEDANVTPLKILLSLLGIAGLFFLLRIFKK